MLIMLAESRHRRCKLLRHPANAGYRESVGRQADRAWTILARKYELPVLKTASVINALGGAGDRGN
jgi:hypothetical protein